MRVVIEQAFYTDAEGDKPRKDYAVGEIVNSAPKHWVENGLAREATAKDKDPAPVVSGNKSDD